MILTEIATLEPKDQADRLKEVEKLPLKADNLMRIQNLRNNIESLPSPSNRHAVTHNSRFLDSDFNDFSLSPEILSEKLYDSVKMIRDLMNSNKILKETIEKITQQRKNFEIENIQLQNENQELLEKNEKLQNLVSAKDEEIGENELAQNRKERDFFLKKIKKLKNSRKTLPMIYSTEDKEWKTKRTILKSNKNSHEYKPQSLVKNNRNYNQRKKSFEQPIENLRHRPLSQEFVMDSSKTEAIETLSRILMKGQFNY